MKCLADILSTSYGIVLRIVRAKMRVEQLKNTARFGLSMDKFPCTDNVFDKICQLIIFEAGVVPFWVVVMGHMTIDTKWI